MLGFLCYAGCYAGWSVPAVTRERLVTAIDVGTTKTCVMLAEQQENGSLQLVAAGVAPSRGIKRGVVVGLEQASASIQAATEQCERGSGRRIDSAVVSIAGSHCESQNTRGVTLLGGRGHELSAGDVQKAVESSRSVAVPPDREIIHVVPRSFRLDGEDGIQNPVGMSGQRLEVETHLVTGAVGAIQNLIKSVQRTGLELDDLVLQPLASAEACMTDEERELGGVLIDFGGGTTDVAVFLDGSVWHTAVLPFGGWNVTNDIGICLRTPLSHAEELKIAYGHTHPEAVRDLPPLDVSTFERHRVRQVSRDYLAQIIQARVEEILCLVADELRRSGYTALLGAGVVLTGGGAEQAGIKESAEAILDLPVRVGQPRLVEQLGGRFQRPAFAAVVGLLGWAQRAGIASRCAATQRPAMPELAGKTLGTAGRWLRAFVP